MKERQVTIRLNLPDKPKLAANFDQGQAPTIVCINQASTPFGDFNALVAALQKFVNVHFAPVWGTRCKLVVGTGFQPGCWAIVFVDNADVANALGYHDLTNDGLPLSHIFVQTTIQSGEEVSVTASHELAEMLVDPGIQLASAGPRGLFYAYEVADACEHFRFTIDGINMTDFVYPAWFEAFRKPGSARFDHLALCKKPFQILQGGYMPVFSRGRWTQIFGAGGQKAFAAKEHSRGPRRGKQPKKSKPQ